MPWYIDCYHSDKNFPVNSYGPGTLNDMIKIMNQILSSSKSGINEVRITSETKGCFPMSIQDNERLNNERL